ncbi:MAG: hypothetical protein A3A97_01215 [Candidatus Terrybacteria bacterium RIFCSPLOWO2_01_FULL_40_23]|uniref:DUF3761 domain-containing protein n=1 Tax=Candidatus Terrybacteria bacterium RIFCSPLOWO2_01_FULL_40_23 TaxID=1802366 RepID=A0A1G2PWN3_9BACT|nr:MAG: hypothetical protein A3A97_01215 [Candidatus Terrybacteria bacterium RIFCSPLOWO2_01_FULL_40_23]
MNITKKILVGVGTFGAILFLFTTVSDPSAYSTQTQQGQVVAPQLQVVAPSVQPSFPPTIVEPEKEVVKVTPPPVDTANLSNDNYYINVDGNNIHSPAYSDNGVPAGASAQCGDGTYSFSQHRSGTCSHHGGVAMWL